MSHFWLKKPRNRVCSQKSTKGSNPFLCATSSPQGGLSSGSGENLTRLLYRLRLLFPKISGYALRFSGALKSPSPDMADGLFSCAASAHCKTPSAFGDGLMLLRERDYRNDVTRSAQCAAIAAPSRQCRSLQIPFSAPYGNNTNSKMEFVLFFARDFFGMIVRFD